MDILATIFAGSFGYLVVESLYRANLKTLFIPEFLGSAVIGAIAIFGHTMIPDGSLSAIIIAAVMPIVPGVLITNAIQDLFGGHMMMFTTKSLEALVTSFGIGAGVGTMLLIFRRDILMFWLLNFIFSCIASLFFCVIFDAPKRMYIWAGLVGACGWMVYIVLFRGLELHTIYASFFGSLALGLLSHIMARIKRNL